MFEDYSLGLVHGFSSDRPAYANAAIYVLSRSNSATKGELFFADGPDQGRFTIDDSTLYKERFLKFNELQGYAQFNRHNLARIGGRELDELRRVYRYMKNSARGEPIYDSPHAFVLDFAKRLDEEGVGRGGRWTLHRKIEDILSGGAYRRRQDSSCCTIM